MLLTLFVHLVKWTSRSSYSKTERAMMRDVKARQRAYEREHGRNGIRYDAVLGLAPRSSDVARSMIETMSGEVGQFVLARGVEYRVAPSAVPMRIQEPRMCFVSAALMVLLDERYEYVEGFCVLANLPSPVHHAWVVRAGDDEVIDSTLGWRSDARYFGVKVARTLLVEKLRGEGAFGLFVDPDGPTDLVRRAKHSDGVSAIGF